MCVRHYSHRSPAFCILHFAFCIDLGATTIQPSRLTRTIPIAPGTPIYVDATAGEIRVTGRDATEVSVEIASEAPDPQQLAALQPSISVDSGALRIVARQANGGMDPRVRSTILLDVPRSARLESIKLLTGRIALSGLAGRITAEVTRGTLHATDIAGTVRLETGTGDLTCERARLTAGGLLRLRTFNGQLLLQLAAKPTDARILALSFNGRITSDIPLQLKEQWGPRFGEATIGNGEPVISLDTVTGDIQIKIERVSQKLNAKMQSAQSRIFRRDHADQPCSACFASWR